MELDSWKRDDLSLLANSVEMFSGLKEEQKFSSDSLDDSLMSGLRKRDSVSIGSLTLLRKLTPKIKWEESCEAWQRMKSSKDYDSKTRQGQSYQGRERSNTWITSRRKMIDWRNKCSTWPLNWTRKRRSKCTFRSEGTWSSLRLPIQRRTISSDS